MTLGNAGRRVLLAGALSAVALLPAAACGKPAREREMPPTRASAPRAAPDPAAPTRPRPPEGRERPRPGDADATDRDLPGDRFERHPMGGYRYNASREERRQAKAHARLRALARELPSLAPEALLRKFAVADQGHFWNPTGVDYYVFRDQTPLIERELRRRGEAARVALRRCAGDRRYVFTGSAGPPLTLGEICSRLLGALPGAARP